MADEIRVDYEQLRLIASQFGGQADASYQTYQLVQRKMNQLHSGWVGRGSAAFFAEMSGAVLPAMNRLTAALRQARAVTLQISAIMAAAEEEAARPFNARDGFDWDRFIETGKTGFNWLDTAMTWLPIPAAVALAWGLRAGATYGGQVIISAPQLLRNLGIGGRTLRELAGVSPYLNHIKAANIAGHISGVAVRGMIGVEALISVGKGAFAVADVWHQNRADYANYDGSGAASARAVDAGLAVTPVAGEFVGGVGGIILGAKGGALLGGAIGSVVPGLGTAVGAAAGGIIGGALGGLGGNAVGGQLGQSAADWLNENVGRSGMIDWVDHNVAQPVADAVTGAWDAVGSWFAPQPQPALP